MSRRSPNLAAIVVVLSFLFLVACTAAPEPQPAVKQVETEEAVTGAMEAETPCDFDEQTCAYLNGKDFNGETLTVGVWGGDIEEILRDVVIPSLEARGAQVELLLGGAGDRLAKLYAEKDNPTMDVAYLNIHTSRQAVRDGVAEPASNEVPAYADLYPIAREGDIYGVSFLGLGIQYNTDAFAGPPEWADLWQPEHKGKIAFPTFPSTGGDGLIAVAARLEGKDERDVDTAFAKIAELKPVPLVYTNLDELALLMETGEVVAAPNLSGYAWTAVDNSDKIGFSFPQNPGPILAMDALVITNGSPHRELALAWTQLALSPKTQQAYAERIYFGPTNSKVELPPELAEKVVYGPDRVQALVNLDWDFVAEQRTGLTERWNKEIIEE